MLTRFGPLGRKYLPGLLLLAAAVLITLGVIRRFRLPGQANLIASMAMDMNGMKPEPGAVPVATSRVVLRTVQPQLTYSGTVKGLNEISLAARVDGTLTAVPVYTGSKVVRGQLLAQLSAPELNARTQAALSEQAQARQELAVLDAEALRIQADEKAAGAEVAQQQAALQAAQANAEYWQQRLPREQALYDAGGISLEELQRYQADARVAAAEATAARQRITAAGYQRQGKAALLAESRQRRKSLQAGLERAGAGVQERRVMQGFTRITAPVTGVVTERLEAPGSVVTAGTPLLTLAQIDSVRIQIRVPEADLGALRVGGTLSFSTAARPNDEIEATLTSLSPAAGNGTRMHLAEAIVPNPEGLLLPGQYVQARLQSGAGQPAGPAIPERAVFQLEGQDSVWVKRNGRAHLSPVEIVARSGEWVSVGQLAQGTEVITDGYQDLTEGMAVTAVRWTENGPERMPEAGGEHRLNQDNRWTLQSPLGEGLMLRLSLEPSPPTAGRNQIRFELSRAGTPVADGLIKLATSMPAMNMGGPSLTAAHQGDGKYTATLSGMSGLWQVVAVIETGGRRWPPFTFEFNIP